MLQKLRFRFIALAMSVVFLVLALIIGLANILNYRHVVTSSDNLLEFLMENDGRFPDIHEPKGNYFDRGDSPEFPFETRFFTVRFDQEGDVLSVDTKQIAAITPDDAIAYAQELLEESRTRGFVGEYRFAIRKADTDYLVIFLDCGRQLTSARIFLWTSVCISLAGFLLVSLLILILSARLVKPIAESYEKQRQFITNASHDLKTPITIINADMDILEMDVGENEWILDVQKQTRCLTELIGELVFLSRMDEKDHHFQMIDFPVSDIVSEAALSFEAPARTHGKSLSIHVEPMLSCRGDTAAIRRLVTILMDNALKYSDDKGSISLCLKKTERSLRLTVFNTCASIENDELKCLFDRFYRGDKSRNSQNGGYGIGLSIAQAIVKAHGGKISARTEDNRSLTITVTLPNK